MKIRILRDEKMSEFIEFELIEKKPKTDVYAVNNKTSGDMLGIIKWYPAWRQYCFFPSEETLYERKCLKDINNFMQRLMDER